MRDAAAIHQERILRDAASQGDADAWLRLYESAFDDVYRYLLWRLAGDTNSAEELAQEVWLVAVERLAEFDPELGCFRDWTRGVARGLLKNTLRKQQRRRETHFSEATLEAHASEDCEKGKRAGALIDTLNELPEIYEHVLRAKYLYGESVADMASGLGRTQKSVESLLSRARAALRARYDTDNDEADHG